MAKLDRDIVGRLLQEAFSHPDGGRRLLEHLLNEAMQTKASDHLGAEPHQRSVDRRGYRNGGKPRRVNTQVGELKLDVPQVRACEPYHPSMFTKWQRSERALLVACAEMSFRGVSTRNVRHVLEQLCHGDISSATVSRVAQEVDEKLLTFRIPMPGVVPSVAPPGRPGMNAAFRALTVRAFAALTPHGGRARLTSDGPLGVSRAWRLPMGSAMGWHGSPFGLKTEDR